MRETASGAEQSAEERQRRAKGRSSFDGIETRWPSFFNRPDSMVPG